MGFLDILTYILYIIIAILVLLVMITVHELGHYLTGKLFKFGIKEFSIGFGPKLLQKTNKSGELITLRAIPLGGYCSFEGEDGDSDKSNAFHNMHPFKRILVLISGALMNYLLAILVIVIMFGCFGQSLLVVTDPVDSGAYRFQPNDVIVKIDGKNVYMPTDLIVYLQDKTVAETEQTPVIFTVIRNKNMIDVPIKLTKNAHFENIEDFDEVYSVLGIKEEVGLKQTRVRYGFFTTIGRSFEYSFRIATTIFTILHQLIVGKVGISSMGGVITTVTTTANAIKVAGVYYLLQITALIGVNLAVFNLLPFPALDGCQVLFTVIEWVTKRPVNKKVQGIINACGLVLLLLFSVFVDVQHLF